MRSERFFILFSVFIIGDSEQREDAWTSRGVRCVQKLPEKAKKHAKSNKHRDNVLIFLGKVGIAKSFFMLSRSYFYSIKLGIFGEILG